MPHITKIMKFMPLEENLKGEKLRLEHHRIHTTRQDMSGSKHLQLHKRL